MTHIKQAFKEVKEKLTTPNQLKKQNIKINQDGKIRSAFDLLSFNNVSFDDLTKIWPNLSFISRDAKEQIEIESKYSAYLERQLNDINDFKKDENLILPKNIDYKKVGSLSNEIIEKLSSIQPPTLGAASRISGITPAAIISLLRYVKRRNNLKAV